MALVIERSWTGPLFYGLPAVAWVLPACWLDPLASVSAVQALIPVSPGLAMGRSR